MCKAEIWITCWSFVSNEKLRVSKYDPRNENMDNRSETTTLWGVKLRTTIGSQSLHSLITYAPARLPTLWANTVRPMALRASGITLGVS